jgi:FtsH-binding integral membrane protein
MTTTTATKTVHVDGWLQCQLVVTMVFAIVAALFAVLLYARELTCAVAPATNVTASQMGALMLETFRKRAALTP